MTDERLMTDELDQLSQSIINLTQPKREGLLSLSEYLDLGQTVAKQAILVSVFEEILKAGYSEEELVTALACFSYRWGFEPATAKIENAAIEFYDHLKNKAQSESGN